MWKGMTIVMHMLQRLFALNLSNLQLNSHSSLYIFLFIYASIGF